MQYDSYSVINTGKSVGKKIKVSVIMPSLNVVEYIENAVESVLNQTLHDIEILCIEELSRLSILNAEDHELIYGPAQK